MKVLEIKETEKYKEIVLQKSFMFIKWNVTFRKYGKEIFEYKSPDKHYLLGVFEWYDINPFFNIEK